MRLILTGCLLLFVAGSGSADIFDDPENLKVLDADTTPMELRRTMRQMAMGLGVRCAHCHVGEADQNLREFDFVSDDKPAKAKARLMLKMVQDINQQLAAGIKDQSIEVQCITCHRGVLKPEQTVHLLRRTFEEQGMSAALSKYDELRGQYYGSHSHDFTQSTLLSLAQMIHRKDVKAAQLALEKNLTLFPNDFSTLVALGDAHAAQKSNLKATSYYQKAKQIQPQPWLDQKLQRVKE